MKGAAAGGQRAAHNKKKHSVLARPLLPFPSVSTKLILIQNRHTNRPHNTEPLFITQTREYFPLHCAPLQNTSHFYPSPAFSPHRAETSVCCGKSHSTSTLQQDLASNSRISLLCSLVINQPWELRAPTTYRDLQPYRQLAIAPNHQYRSKPTSFHNSSTTRLDRLIDTSIRFVMITHLRFRASIALYNVLLLAIAFATVPRSSLTLSLMRLPTLRL